MFQVALSMMRRVCWLLGALLLLSIPFSYYVHISVGFPLPLMQGGLIQIATGRVQVTIIERSAHYPPRSFSTSLGRVSEIERYGTGLTRVKQFQFFRRIGEGPTLTHIVFPHWALLLAILAWPVTALLLRRYRYRPGFPVVPRPMDDESG